ncbi:hypothetical protein [Yoonia vestfoldensis]|uniref:hypothetical protein n=1 Tax=Yoonia vestfoldensis TaxID=245188 RepID=UPI00035F12D1|nr:hypothetical protein [Yoonia vestfoldensis]
MRWVFFPFIAGRKPLGPFTDLYGYRVADALILLYLTNVLCLLVPVTAFDDAGQKADLIACLDKAGLRSL